jgi:hypothetical protein
MRFPWIVSLTPLGRLESVVADSQLSCDYCQPGIRRPQFQPPDQCGRQEMRIDPANTPAVELPLSYELSNLTLRHGRCLMHLFEVRQQPLPSALVPTEEFPVNELMTAHFAAAQKSV